MNNINKINATIVADSINNTGERITTMLLTYPRIIHSEIMTHRMFSRNAASSRAVPFEKLVQSIKENPFIPIAWQKEHKGMQGSEYFQTESGENIHKLTEGWLQARDTAIQIAQGLNNSGVTKQLCNRLLEPFQYYTCLVTSTEWDNFFRLRNSVYQLNEGVTFKSRKEMITHYRNIDFSDKDNLWWLQLNKGQAEIHLMDLAEKMYDVYQENKPKLLKEGEWHIPFGDNIDEEKLTLLSNYFYSQSGGIVSSEITDFQKELMQNKIKIAVARCARTSYTTFGQERNDDYEADIKLFDRLKESKHASPFEHIAKAMTENEYYTFVKGKGEYEPVTSITQFDEKDYGWCNNFKGFIQYRYLLENNLI